MKATTQLMLPVVGAAIWILNGTAVGEIRVDGNSYNSLDAAQAKAERGSTLSLDGGTYSLADSCSISKRMILKSSSGTVRIELSGRSHSGGDPDRKQNEASAAALRKLLDAVDREEATRWPGVDTVFVQTGAPIEPWVGLNLGNHIQGIAKMDGGIYAMSHTSNHDWDDRPYADYLVLASDSGAPRRAVHYLPGEPSGLAACGDYLAVGIDIDGEREIRFYRVDPSSLCLRELSHLRITDAPGYDVSLMSVAATDDLVDSGECLVIVALVGSELHVRIFDLDGQKVVDKTESELTRGPELTSLKELLNESPFPDQSGLFPEVRRDIIEKAISISGHTITDDVGAEPGFVYSETNKKYYLLDREFWGRELTLWSRDSLEEHTWDDEYREWTEHKWVRNDLLTGLKFPAGDWPLHQAERKPNNSFPVSSAGDRHLYLLVGDNFSDLSLGFGDPRVHMWRIDPQMNTVTSLGMMETDVTFRYSFGGYVTTSGEIEIITSERNQGAPTTVWINSTTDLP